MRKGYRPPGAIFFLLRRRKNMERKTPRESRGWPAASVRPLAFALQMPYLIERERGSKTAPFTLSLPGARSNCVRHRSRALYGVPGRLVTASVPCGLVCGPLAASLLLTHCGCGLGDFFWLAGFCVLIFSMRKGWRPPGAIFFLLRRRKNMERKTPLRAGGPALRTHPWYSVGTAAAHGTGYQAGL